MGELEEKLEPGDRIAKMVRLLESKAKAAGVTREEYASGIANGKYQRINEGELNASLDG